jgi:uncharacterized membrane protein YesL
MGIFNMDGPIYRIGTILADILILGVLWLVFSLPVVTIGASTTAVYYVFTKRINGREGYLWQDFWRSFRQNFLMATAVWLTLLLIYAFLVFNITNVGLLEAMTDFVLVAQFIILVQAIFVTMYAFPLISRFEMGYVEVFKTAFFLANRHILLTISCAVLFISAIIIALLMPVFLLAVAGAYCYFSSFLFVKAFKKYRPDLDLVTGTGEVAPLQLDEGQEARDDSTVLNLDKLKEMRDK